MKPILDATAGGRQMHFNKSNPNVLYIDKRELEPGSIELQPNFKIKPDLIASFTDLPFDDSTFYLVIFDPPHIKTKAEGIMTKKYGKLGDDWEDVLKSGFDECWRVLKPNGTLIFKWWEGQVKVSQIVKLFGKEPVVGHTTGKSGKTKWITYFKGGIE